MGLDDEPGDPRAGVVRGCKRIIWPPGGLRSQGGFACLYGGSTVRGGCARSSLSPRFSEVINQVAGGSGAPLVESARSRRGSWSCQLRIHGVATAYSGTAVGDLRATFKSCRFFKWSTARCTARFDNPVRSVSSWSTRTCWRA